jgi:ankyrin repeat protein
MSQPLNRQKRLPVNPSEEHLKKQAKRLAKEHPGESLAHAQHTLAQQYGCKSWAELMHVVQVMNRGANTLVSGDSDGKPRYQPLPAAVRKRDVPTVQAILASGQYTIHDLDTGLAHACWYGGSHPDVLKVRKQLFDLLLAHGADPDGEYGSNYGPIVFGTGECLSHEGLQWLLDAGCDVTFQPIPTKYGSNCPLSMVLGGYERGPDNSSKHRMIRTLLSHGAVIPPDVSPPILAIHMGDHQTLANLLDKDPALLTKRFPDMPYGNLPLPGGSLLHQAVEFVELECIDLLIDRGADINLPALIIDGLGGQTPVFHAIAGTYSAASLDSLKRLINKAGTKIDMSVSARVRITLSDPLPHAMTPLQYAQFMAGPSAPQWLRNRKHAPQELALVESIHHGPALIAASKSANLKTLQSLIAQAVDPDYQDTDHTTALWQIAQSTAPDQDRLACASFLLDHRANPNRQIQNNATPYHLAAQHGPASLLKLFQDKGALSWTHDNQNRRALEYAQASTTLSPTEKQAIIALIEKPRISDPLFAQAVLAIDQGDLQTLKSLLQAHPYLATAKADEPGSYAGPYFAHPALLWFIAENPIRNKTLPKNICEIAHAIIDAGATLDDINYTLGLVCSGNVPRETRLAASLIQTLVSRGADPTGALASAVSEREIPAIKTLLQLGAKPDLPTAAALADAPLLTTLLASKPDPATLAKAWKTAATFGHVEILTLLLAQGVDINTVDSQNATALHHAALNNHKPAVLFLLQNGANATSSTTTTKAPPPAGPNSAATTQTSPNSSTTGRCN